MARQQSRPDEAAPDFSHQRAPSFDPCRDRIDKHELAGLKQRDQPSRREPGERLGRDAGLEVRRCLHRCEIDDPDADACALARRRDRKGNLRTVRREAPGIVVLGDYGLRPTRFERHGIQARQDRRSAFVLCEDGAERRVGGRACR
ncbi:MAG TPA: hypothetical protein VE570_05300, partial [Thermoleophilaceae bacterium]|nr:hypothetical protein [Thermoleophilaceae bacterium]